MTRAGSSMASCAQFTLDTHGDPRVGYDIRVDPHSPSTLRVEMRFQPPSESMTEWVVSASKWGKEVQVAEVQADGTLILADQQRHWQVPPHTKSLSWKVVLREGAGESSYDPEEPRWKQWIPDPYRFGRAVMPTV